MNIDFFYFIGSINGGKEAQFLSFWHVAMEISCVCVAWRAKVLFFI